MSGARKKGAIEPSSDGKCPCNHYLIKGVVMDKSCVRLRNGILLCDYHWYRQNDDGSWSHKPGDRSPIPHVDDPVQDAKRMGYDKDCGNLCVKSPGLETD